VYPAPYSFYCIPAVSTDFDLLTNINYFNTNKLWLLYKGQKTVKMSRRHFKIRQIIAINTITAGIAPWRAAGRPLSSPPDPIANELQTQKITTNRINFI